MTKTQPIRVNSDVTHQLKKTCQDNGFSMSYVVTRLVERFLEGSFSGSFSDIIREGAGNE